jgi:hypothetical protein
MSAALRSRRIAKAGVVVAVAVAAAAGALMLRSRPVVPDRSLPDARALDAPLIEIATVPVRAVPGLKRVERERRPGPDVRLLLLGERVHACSFDRELRAMSCSVIDHETQYGPHGEADVEYAETELGAPGWVVVPDRGSATPQAVPQEFFELRPQQRVLAHHLWVKAFIGADRRVAVIQTYLEEDVLVHGQPGQRLSRVKLPAPSGATRLAGEWLLWPGEGDELLVTRATGSVLEPTQTLAGKYSGVGCHGERGTWLLGERDGRSVVFVESQGRWSTLPGADPRLQPARSAGDTWGGYRATTLTCTERGAIIVAQDAHRLDPRKPGVEACAGPGECRYSLELGVTRCDHERCRSEPLRSVDLGSGGIFGRPKVLPTGQSLLVLWMTVLEATRMQWLHPNGTSPVRTVAGGVQAHLAEAWSRGDVAVALFTDREPGAVRAIRFGPGEQDVSAADQL